MKIFVTGATGFLGSHLCRYLTTEGHEITAVGSKECDLTHSAGLLEFSGTKFDHIYHLAAWTQAGDFCLHHPGEQWVKNQLINTHVLDWWQADQPQAKLIAMGSSCCYDPEDPLVETNFLHGKPIESLYTYGMTKRMLYIGMKMLSQQFGLKHLCLVPSTLYGADYHLDGRQMHFIFDLIRKIVGANRGGPAVELWGDGHQARELIHVHDFVKACTTLAGQTENELINVGSGEEHTIREFAGHICDLTGYDPEKITYDTTKYTGARSKVLNVEKLRSLLPGMERTPLVEGLKETVEWFIDAHPESE